MNSKCIKVSLEVNKAAHLIVVNTELDVECIVKEICEEYNIPYRRGIFALKVRDFCKLVGTEYLTDENKTELKHGKHLKLSKSPSERVGVLVERLHKSTDSESSMRNLNCLALASNDSILLAEMNKQNVLRHLREFASSRSLSEDEYYRLYKVIGQFLSEGYTKKLWPEEVNHLVCLVAWDQKASKEILILAFELLIMLRKNGELEWPMECSRKLTPYLRQYGEHKLQERSINFINVLYLYSKDEQEKNAIQEFMKSSIMITYINKYVIREYLSDEVKRQLYFYQKIILQKYDPQLRLIVPEERKIFEKLESFFTNSESTKQERGSSSEDVEIYDRDKNGANQIPKVSNVSSSTVDIDRSASVPGTRCSGGSDSDTEERRQLNREISVETVRGFRSPPNPGISPYQSYLSPVEIRPSQSVEEIPSLAWSNLYYFIFNDFKGFKRLALIHRNNPKSILRESTEITFLLSRIFEIGENYSVSNGGQFVPLSFLYYDYFMEKMFSIVFKLFHDSREEMKIPVDSSEYPVVLKAVQDRVVTALEYEPVEFLELETRLKEITVHVITNKRQLLIKEEVRRLLTEEPGFVQLKQILTPRIIDKIKDKRLRFMESGEHVPEFDYKGQRIAGKKLFLHLSKRRDRLFLHECLDNPCRNNHTPLEAVFISDIREIEFGSKSNFHKEVYYNLYTERDMFFRAGTRQQEPDLKFPISLKLNNLNYIDFSAGSQLTMDYWVDGLHYLTGEKTSSETSKEEFDYLLDIELMSRLAELEGIDLPKKAPAVPPLPPDYNFAVD